MTVPSTVAGRKDGTVDSCRWEGRYRRRWPVGRTVPSTVASGKDSTVDCGRWELRYRRQWSVGRAVPSTPMMMQGVLKMGKLGMLIMSTAILFITKIQN